MRTLGAGKVCSFFLGSLDKAVLYACDTCRFAGVLRSECLTVGERVRRDGYMGLVEVGNRYCDYFMCAARMGGESWCHVSLDVYHPFNPRRVLHGCGPHVAKYTIPWAPACSSV